MRYIIFFCILFSTGFCKEQPDHPTLHIILYGDPISNDLKMGTKVDVLRMKENFSIIARKIRYKKKIITLSSENAKARNILLKKALRSVHKGDTVLYYFSGHGHFSQKDTPYPTILFPISQKKYQAESSLGICEAVEKTSAKLKICIFDSCNSGKSKLLFEKKHSLFPVIEKRKSLPGLQTLFAKTTGSVVVIAAAPHQSAILRTAGKYTGSDLTTAFLYSLGHKTKSPKTSWEQIFRSTSFFIKNRLHGDQDPLYRVEKDKLLFYAIHET